LYRRVLAFLQLLFLPASIASLFSAQLPLFSPFVAGGALVPPVQHFDDWGR
jgi:hypothetical protein